MKRIARLALAYYAMIFALGFVLGTLRTLVLVPKLSELAAVSLELPLMLAASWFAASYLLRGKGLGAAQAAAMGALAFALLMVSEVLLSLALGRTAGEWLAAMDTPPGAIGLAGQMIFAAMPLFARRG